MPQRFTALAAIIMKQDFWSGRTTIIEITWSNRARSGWQLVWLSHVCVTIALLCIKYCRIIAACRISFAKKMFSISFRRCRNDSSDQGWTIKQNEDVDVDVQQRYFNWIKWVWVLEWHRQSPNWLQNSFWEKMKVAIVMVAAAALDPPHLDSKRYPLAQDVAKDAPARMNWFQVDVL